MRLPVVHAFELIDLSGLGATKDRCQLSELPHARAPDCIALLLKNLATSGTSPGPMPSPITHAGFSPTTGLCPSNPTPSTTRTK